MTTWLMLEIFVCINLHKINSLEHFIVSYNFKDVLIVREVHEAENIECQVKWSLIKYY